MTTDEIIDIIAKIDAARILADAERPWFIAKRPTDDGLLVIEDGRLNGMFPVKGEAREIELIVAMHNAWPRIRTLLETRQ